jgi:nicotinate-nucleotide pyrophosphorylase (carboxylating)
MQFNASEAAECERILRWGLEEDLGEAGDLTSQAVIDPARRWAARIVARRAGVVAGLPSLAILAGLRGGSIEVQLLAGDGPVEKGRPIAHLSGPARELLAVERTMLNLLSRLSGIATLTARYVAAVCGCKARICDTRKTTPGWRRLEKYAVRVGGGLNHRTGLFDAVLIKDNHLAEIARTQPDPIPWAVARARENAPQGAVVEVEVDSLAQLARALDARPDIVLLDNMTPENLAVAVEMRDRRAPDVLLEASGGISLETVAAIARSGVDRISVGAITHSAPALDLALDDEGDAP